MRSPGAGPGAHYPGLQRLERCRLAAASTMMRAYQLKSPHSPSIVRSLRLRKRDYTGAYENASCCLCLTLLSLTLTAADLSGTWSLTSRWMPAAAPSYSFAFKQTGDKLDGNLHRSGRRRDITGTLMGRMWNGRSEPPK